MFFSEVGNDVSKFKNRRHFTSWLNICPGNKISGGKILSPRTLPGKNRLAQALKMSAMSLSHSKSYLGNYYRRKRAKNGAPNAITDTAHQKRVLKNLKTKTKTLGFQLVPCG
ncbi:MAG: IS110 family transposase [Proteobacteria bacterium]|nr:IS110 family transposase [Pseudomonadota bacterium]